MNNTDIDDKPSGRPASAQVRFIGTLILCCLPLLMTASTPPTLLEHIKENGFLQVISLNGPSTYYEGRFGHAGFEYELAKAFADHLGVELTVTIEQSLSQILNSMPTTDNHFAAAGLSILDERKKNIDFSIPYATVTQQVIYRRGDSKPKTFDDILEKDIVVIRDSSHEKTLSTLQQEFPSLQWRVADDIENPELIEMVHRGDAEIALVDSNAFISNRSVYPKARLGFDLTTSENIAWGFPKRKDKSLLNAANTFLRQYIESGHAEKLSKKYFDQPVVDESSALAFSRRIDARLPQWVDYFQSAAEKFQLDWLFLAAMSYQESLWNKDAKSFTGVRGLMMLTHKTAKDLGIKDRTDPQQSIFGGAEYFTQIRKRIPDDIVEPDRTWMALAAYNVGMGHLEDARVITERQGGNPDQWEDVKKRLPLLARKKYYRQTKHGYARGWEPVHYVENIRKYHNILIWHYSNKQRQIEADTHLEEALENSPLKNPSLPQL